MAFEPNFEKVVTSVRKNLGVTQSQVDIRVPIESGISKILCSNANVNVLNVETNMKDVLYSGVVSFQMVYLDENNEAQGVNYSAEFKDKYNTNFDLINIVPIVSANVVDTSTSVNGDLKVVVTLETSIDGIINNSTNIVTNIIGDTYLTKKETFDFANYFTKIVNSFEISNDVEIKDGVNKVLSVCPSIQLEKASSNDGFVNVEGVIYYDICYLTDNEIIRTMQSSFEFNQELPYDDILDSDVIQAVLKVIYNDIKITTSIDVDNTSVNIITPLLFEGCIYKLASMEIVSDVFSTSNYINLSAESINSIRPFDNISFDEKLNGNIVIDDGELFIDEVLGNCCNSVIIANQMVRDNFLIVEGVATTTVLYLNKETNSIKSVVVEMPFSTSTSVDYKDDVEINVQVSLTELNSRVRRGKEIEVSALLCVYANVYSTTNSVVITKVEEEDEYPDNECAMSFYITREGDDIWRIAKELKVSPDTIIAQNSNLIDPIESGSKVVVYRQRQVEF